MPFDDVGTGTAARKCADCGEPVGPPIPGVKFRKGLLDGVQGPLCARCIPRRLGRPMIFPDDIEPGCEEAVRAHFDKLKVRIVGTIGDGGIVTPTPPT